MNILIFLLLVSRAIYAEPTLIICTVGSAALDDSVDHPIIAITNRTYIRWKDEAPTAAPFEYREAQVLELSTNRVLGKISVKIEEDGSAHLPLVMDVQGEGFGTEAKFALLKYVFDVWHVRFVTAKIRRENIASHRLHDKLGFHRLSRTTSAVWDYHLSAGDFEVVRRHVEGH